MSKQFFSKYIIFKPNNSVVIDEIYKGQSCLRDLSVLKGYEKHTMLFPEKNM